MHRLSLARCVCVCCWERILQGFNVIVRIGWNKFALSSVFAASDAVASSSAFIFLFRYRIRFANIFNAIPSLEHTHTHTHKLNSLDFERKSNHFIQISYFNWISQNLFAIHLTCFEALTWTCVCVCVPVFVYPYEHEKEK